MKPLINVIAAAGCVPWTWREMNGWFVMLIKAEPSAEQDSLAARPCTDTSN